MDKAHRFMTRMTRTLSLRQCTERGFRDIARWCCEYVVALARRDGVLGSALRRKTLVLDRSERAHLFRGRSEKHDVAPGIDRRANHAPDPGWKPAVRSFVQHRKALPHRRYIGNIGDVRIDRQRYGRGFLMGQAHVEIG